MKEPTDIVQNRFTAYLVAALSNRKMRYLEQRNRLQSREQAGVDLLDKKYTDFTEQLLSYQREQAQESLEHWEDLQEVMTVIESETLTKILRSLKEKEREILFARVFGELSFTEIGKRQEISSKQAEMSYYYILRKIRKGLEGKEDEF